MIIDRVALAKQGDNALGSVCLSVRPSVCLFVYALIFVCVCKCVALAANFADAVDRLLILNDY